MRLVIGWVLCVVLAGCGAAQKRLSSAEQDHYYALRVYMDQATEKGFLRGKTQEERDAYLKSVGLWDRFYKYDAKVRESIVAGDVKVGWTEDMVQMSWGNPYQRRRLTGRPAPRSELLVFRFEIDREGVIRVWEPGSRTDYKAVARRQVELYLDGEPDRMEVTELLEKDTWE